MNVDEARSTDCRTPDVLFGWTYEAINYDIEDDAALKAANPDMRDCTSQGEVAGDALISFDGVTRLAGWYIPAASGAGPTAPTIVLVHGYAGKQTLARIRRQYRQYRQYQQCRGSRRGRGRGRGRGRESLVRDTAAACAFDKA